MKGKKLRTICSLALVLVMVIGTFAPGVTPTRVHAEETVQGIQAEFFVSPMGNDENDGSYEHPFMTLTAARDAVRKINKDMTGDIYVFIAEGEYYIDETVVFDEQDSGTNGYQIIYRNLDGLSSASFIGGYKLEAEWNLVERTGADADLPAIAEGKVYKTHVGTDNIFDTLYVNDERATLARTQNLDQYEGFSSALTPFMKSAGGGIGDLIYRAGDLDEESINGLVNAQKRGDLDASVYMWDGGYWDWMTDTIPVSAIDTGSRKLTYKTVAGQPELYRPKYSTGVNARYFVQGNLGFLDAPGEYYFNKTTGDLYYYPKEGTIEEQNIIIPKVKEIIRIEGESRDSMVENIEFSGLQFKDTDTTDWYAYGWNWGDNGSDGLGFYPKEAAGSTQPSYCEQTERIEFQYGIITLKNTKNITISKSHITNSGMFGIDLYLANQNTVIEDCLIDYTGHGGMNIDGGYPGVAGDDNGDGYSRDNIVRNTIIHDVGELVGQASGLTVQQSSYNTFSNLEIYNSPRRGIFITAGHSRNPNTPFPNGDKDFDIMRDMYSHHNTFEYIYMSNCQQDGGDDGAFFGCYLYKGEKNRPNYINQMLIDSIGPNPTMADLGPNCMNLDMGCSGFELSNVKAINPMNFNIQVNTILQYGDVITFDNVNIDYGSLANHIDEFDDSKMEYDKIGVTSNYPVEYLTDRRMIEKPEDIYFEEDFEKGLDYTKWSYKGKTPVITTQWISEGGMGGRQGLQLSDNGTLYRKFDQELNKVVTVKMFDRQNNNLAAYDSGRQNSSKATSIARVDDGENIIGIGLDVNNMSNYVVQLGNDKVATKIPRVFGWHEFKFDYTSGTDVKLYIDDVLVETVPATGFNYVSMGSDDGYGIVYYDQLYIYGGEVAEAPGSVPIPEAPEYDSSNDNMEQLNLDMEDGVLPNFDPVKDSYMQIVEDPDNVNNKVLENDVQDGHSFYQTDAPWDNYVVNLKWKFDGWGSNDVLGGIYDNFTIYVMTNLKGDDRPTNPGSYQVIYRRNKNGTSEYAAGTPYFEIKKHARTGDATLGSAAVPEGFVESDWHTLQIQTFDGKVGFIVDGVELITASDGAYTYGGVGFGGINCKVYMDDIQITSNPIYVEYPENFGLTNAKINGSFNPNHYLYGAEIEDKEQPVTMVMPTPVLEGAKVSVDLNGTNITEQFDGQAVELDLITGLNVLVISEITAAGSKDYTIRIDKSVPIAEVDELPTVETTVGVVPELPNEVRVTYENGETQNVTILWDFMNPWVYKVPGFFEVKGQLKDTNVQVSTTISVDGIQSVDGLADIITEVGTEPTLPTTVSAQLVSGITELPLQFTKADASLYQNKGVVILVAEAEGYASDLLQKVIVNEKGTDPEPQPEYVTVTFKANGGVVSPSSLKLEKGKAYGTLPTPTRKGYNFLGWYNGSTLVKSTDLCNKDVTLTAKWEKQTNPEPQPEYVTVTFNANGGNVSMSTMAVEKGTAYGTLPTATREGYNFLGWYNGTIQVKSTDICNKDVTLTAKWEEIKDDSNLVTKITLNTTKKSVVKGTSFTLKAEVAPSSATNKKLTWTSSNTKVATVDANGKVTAKRNGKATIKATATDGSEVSASCDVTVAYKITYVMNKGENHKSNPSMYYNTKVSLKAPSRKGYTFGGWYTDKNFKHKISSISASSSKDITVYAKWEKIKVGKVTAKNPKSKVAGTMTVNYNKVKNVSGYEIVYGKDSKITKNKKTVTTKSSSVTIKKLKKGGTYYVKVRAYKKDSAGKNVYGAYSKVVKVQIRK